MLPWFLVEMSTERMVNTYVPATFQQGYSLPPSSLIKFETFNELAADALALVPTDGHNLWVLCSKGLGLPKSYSAKDGPLTNPVSRSVVKNLVINALAIVNQLKLSLQYIIIQFNYYLLNLFVEALIQLSLK